MKSRLLQFLGLCLLLAARLSADDPVPLRTPEQLDRLFGPIALYPDALIAVILPATTVPADVVLAARYLAARGDLAKVEDEVWDESVKTLARYPDVLNWMDRNLSWTKQAGDAFVAQPADVMNSVQRLRAKARAAGTLLDTAQQRVVLEEEHIRILPRDVDVIYVPVYDPEVVYVSRTGFYSEPFLSFGVGYATGFWLGYDLDWGRHRVWIIDRHDCDRYRHDHHDGRHSSFPDRVDRTDDPYHRRAWGPHADSHRPTRQEGARTRPAIDRPVTVSNEPSNHRPVYDPNRGGRDSVPGDRHQPHSTDVSSDQSNRHRSDRPDFSSPPNNPTTVTPVSSPSPANSTPTVRVNPTGPSPRDSRDRMGREPHGPDQPSRPSISPVAQNHPLPDHPAPTPRFQVPDSAPSRVQQPSHVQQPARVAAPAQERAPRPERTSAPARASAPERTSAPDRAPPPQQASSPDRSPRPEQTSAPDRTDGNSRADRLQR